MSQCTRLAGVVCLALFFISRLETPVVNHDAFHAMALAREAVALGRVPAEDLYSYAPTIKPVVHHEWAAGFAALAAMRLAGEPGLLLLWLAVAVATAALCALRLRGRSPATAFMAGIVLTPLLAYSFFQPAVAQAYSVLFTALLLRWMEAGRGKLLVVLFAAWANVHAGVVVGLGIVAARAMELRRPRLFGILAAGGVAIALNPWGLAYYPYLARALTMPRPDIGQWQPGWFLQPDSRWALPFLISAALYGYAAVSSRRPFPGALVTGLLLLGAARAHKLLPFYAVAWIFYLPPVLDDTRLARLLEAAARRFDLPLRVALTALASMFCLGLLYGRAWPEPIPARPAGNPNALFYPAGAARYLEGIGFRGNVMTFFRHGAYLSWKLYPAVKVSCDARYEAAYPREHVEANFACYTRNPALLDSELLRLPQTDLILVERRQPLAAELARRREWPAVYRDEAFVLHARPGLALSPQVR